MGWSLWDDVRRKNIKFHFAPAHEHYSCFSCLLPIVWNVTIKCFLSVFLLLIVFCLFCKLLAEICLFVDWLATLFRGNQVSSMLKGVTLSKKKIMLKASFILISHKFLMKGKPRRIFRSRLVPLFSFYCEISQNWALFIVLISSEW